MKLQNLFEYGIEAGKAGDSRPEEVINEMLKEKKETYDKLEGDEKDFFDTDELTNPYLDSAIYHDNGKDIKKVFVGVDAEVQEIVLAERLGIDLVLGHHPEGKALLKLWEMLEVHQEELINHDIPVNVAERLIEDRQDQLKKALHPLNYNRAIDAAKLLDISFANLHQPADNLANKYLKDLIAEKKPYKLKDVIALAMEIEEYKLVAKDTLKPKIVSGAPDNRAGKVFVKFNGGTSGSKDIFKYFEKMGISTMVCMHLPEDHIKEAKKHNINVVIMPHMASDSLGINLLLDKIMEKGNEKLEIIAGSGFVRFSRRNG